MDIGKETITKFSEVIQRAKMIFWNGPMGVFEVDGFHHGTQKLASLIADETEKDVTTIAGGGDSVAAIKQFGYLDQFSHVSSGGGASLELLVGNNLPSIYALEL